MIRTQIQFSKQQLTQLRALAHRRRTSVAALVRQGVDQMLTSGEHRGTTQRAAAVRLAGAFRSKGTRTARAHDRYLAEAYRK